MEDLYLEYKENELQIQDIENKISVAIGDLISKQKELQEKNNLIKEKLKENMEKNGLKNYENDFIKLTYVKPITRTSIDTEKLKDNHYGVYLECLKETTVKASIRIKIKEQEINYLD